MSDRAKLLFAAGLMIVVFIFLAVITQGQDTLPTLRLSTEQIAAKNTTSQEATSSELARRYVANAPDAWHPKLDLAKEEMDALADKLVSIEKAGWRINKVTFLSQQEVYRTFSDNDLDSVDFVLNDSNYQKAAIIHLDAVALSQDEQTLQTLPGNTFIVMMERTGSNIPTWSDMWPVKLK